MLPSSSSWRFQSPTVVRGRPSSAALAAAAARFDHPRAVGGLLAAAHGVGARSAGPSLGHRGADVLTGGVAGAALLPGLLRQVAGPQAQSAGQLVCLSVLGGGHPVGGAQVRGE
ncbi:hypothetical protein GCM10010302_75580 [Streptomyces polychromogenes]|uniref:Uncharacterized protein n=1 Tax=Streptomyces polychromogenes TaxID=67342 RepID=A0ABP3FVC4_9ACTN